MTFNLWTKNRNILHMLENTAFTYYTRSEPFQSRHKKMIFSLMNCAISTEIYEQMVYGIYNRTLFAKTPDKRMLNEIFKLCGTFIFIQCFGAYSEFDLSVTESDFLKCFSLKRENRRHMKYFTTLYQNSPGNFESEYIKYCCKSILREHNQNPYTVAFIANILYNAYQGFIRDYCLITKQSKIA